MNGKEPAFPCSLEFPCIDPSGLTKRELFAAMAMQGQLSSAGDCADSSCGGIAKWAVNYADALLAELAKPQEPTL